MRMKPLLLATLVFAALPAAAQDDALLRCPKIAAPAARLACYDTLLPPIATAATAAAAATESFGLAPKPTLVPQAESLDSTVASDFDGWQPHDLIHLLNGQVWQVIDDSSEALRPRARKVKLTRGVGGSFFLEFDEPRISVRVRRVQ